MDKFILNSSIRNTEDKTKSILADKKLPGVVYGKTTEAKAITLDYSEFLKTFRKTGESHIINLKIDKEDLEVLVHSVQKHPVTGDFIHIDFYAITRGEKVTTKIHLNFIGDSNAIREGAILEEHLKEIEVKCLPRNLVDSFEVNLENLKEIGDSIKVNELNIDEEKYEILTNIEDIVVSAIKPAKVELEEPVVEEIAESEKDAGEEKTEDNK